MSNNHSNALTLPPMLLIRQNFEVPARLEIKAALDAEWDRLVSNLDISPGTRVAVGVGKRTTLWLKCGFRL